MPKDSSAKYRQYEKSKGHVQGIPVNAQGFLVSCHRGKERHATVELLSVLNEFVPEDAVVDQNASIDDQIQAEIAELNKSKAFAVKSLGDCLFFVKSSLEPTAILDQIFSELSSSKQKLTRYVSRIVPLQATCHANVDDIVKITRALIAPWFSLSAVKYSIVQK